MKKCDKIEAIEQGLLMHAKNTSCDTTKQGVAIALTIIRNLKKQWQEECLEKTTMCVFTRKGIDT
jgi:hypothetical protein